MAAVGIAYRHVRQLGDPKPGREAARRGDMAAFRSIFGAHLALEASQEAIIEAAADVKQATVALMCFERAPRECHRSIVAERICDIISAEVVHLGINIERAAGRTDDGGRARRIP